MNVKFCYEHTKPIKYFGMHTHDTWEIIYVYRGKVTHVIDGTDYHLSEGDISVIPPNTEHCSTSDVLFWDIVLNAKNLDLKKVTVVHDYDSTIKTLMLLMCKIVTEKEYNYSCIADSLLDSVTQYIKKYSETTYKHEFVNDLKNILYDNITNTQYSIENEIMKLGYNSDYVRRCFKEEMGITPLSYLTKLRINQAQKLIDKEPNLRIEDVAYRCGFNDCFYFSRIFKKHTGFSPRDYKKK